MTCALHGAPRRSSGDVGRQQIFTASSAISRGPWPRGQLHWSAGRVFLNPFFAQRPQCYLNTCAVPGLLSRRKQEWPRLNQDSVDGEQKVLPVIRLSNPRQASRWVLSKPTIHLRLTADRQHPRGDIAAVRYMMNCGDSPTGPISSSNSMVGETLKALFFLLLVFARPSFLSHPQGPSCGLAGSLLHPWNFPWNNS